MKKLAILGGKPTLKNLKPYRSIGLKEKLAVNDVMRTGKISSFFGSWRDGFLGGKKINELENNWSRKFKVKHSISLNSNTSGLCAAVGAIGTNPGDEIIVPSTSMSATAIAPLSYGAIPVFVDIDEETFCMSVEDVKRKINKKTKAIIVVNLFGHPARLEELKKIAEEREIFLIEDNAQAPLATENKKLTGTIGDIGVFSLNYHKHIHSGEGGICTTDNLKLADRMRMIRNHAEAVVGPAKVDDIVNMVGFNLRMTELSAAIAVEQLNDIERHVNDRVKIANFLSDNLSNLSGISVPKVRKKCTHVYYIWAIKYDENVTGVKRKVFVEALNAQGFPCYEAYLSPLYNLPLFQNRIAYGKNNYPFSLSKINYKKNMCPVAEKLCNDLFICFQPCEFEIAGKKLELLAKAFLEVYSQRSKL